MSAAACPPAPRVCRLCRAVEGDGKPGCIETMPPQHRWETPTKATSTRPSGCLCYDLDARTCTALPGPRPCPCACHGGPEPEPMLVEEAAAPSRATGGAS